MIIYKSSDIIKRAEQLADIENSDFISFTEKIALLNESYISMYQKAINVGDSSFVKTISFEGKRITLPKDFYQLKSVNMFVNGYLTPILRRTSNQSLNDLSYDIINNDFVLYGSYVKGIIRLEYWTTPKSLTLPNKDIILPTNDYASIKGDIYTVLTDDNKLNIRSLNDVDLNETVNLNPLTNVVLVHQEDDFIVCFDENYDYCLINLSDLSTTFNDKIIALYDGKTCIYENNEIVDMFGNVLLQTDFNSTELESCFIICVQDETHAIGLKSSGEVVLSKTNESIQYNAKSIEFYDNVYIINNTNNITEMNFDGDKITKQFKDCICGVVGFNDNTGYGFYSKRLGKNKIISYYEDTVLNFPNNTYFILLSYILALSFKTKQGSDVSALSVLVESAENTFYDTLKRDDYCFTRITNIY